MAKTTLTQEQYLNQFVDFYNQTLGTGIKSTVAKPTTDESGESTGRPQVANGGSQDDTYFSPLGPSFTSNEFNYAIIDANQYVKNNRKSAKRNMDKTDSGFLDYMKGEFLKPETAILGVAGIASGIPLAPIGALAGKINQQNQIKNAEKIAATGGGNMMDVMGQTVSRAPGSKNYMGVFAGNVTSQDIYTMEEISRGYIPGTMVETYSEGSDGKGTYTVSGKTGLLDSATAQALGGNYDAYGNWHSSKFGTVSKSGPLEAAKALASQSGVNTTGWTTKDYVNFSNSWKDSASKYATGVTSGMSVWDKIKSGFSATTGSTLDQYNKDKTSVVNTITNYTPTGGGGGDDSPAPTPVQTGEGSGGMGPDAADSGSGGFTSSGGWSSGGIGAPGLAAGGRIGMQMGGAARMASGFVDRPPSQVPEDQTVADNVETSLPEGTFVINAAAVEFAGEEDIRKMLMDAEKEASRRGISQGDGKTGDIVDVALSRGEVAVAPHLAKIIGYDRLEKINNRGKTEVSRRQQAAEGGFLGLAKGGEAVSPTRKPKMEQLGDIEMRADLDMFIQNDALARLGYMLYENRDINLNAFIATPPEFDEKGKIIRGTRHNLGGSFHPAEGVRYDKQKPVTPPLSSPLQSLLGKRVRTQGVKGPIEDRVPHAFIISGESVNQGRYQQQLTLAHELRHAALDYLSKTYDFKLEPMAFEEQMMDYADYVARQKAANVKPSVGRKFKGESHNARLRANAENREVKRVYDLYTELAENVLRQKKNYPPQSPAKEKEGFLTRAYKSIVN